MRNERLLTELGLLITASALVVSGCTSGDTSMPVNPCVSDGWGYVSDSDEIKVDFSGYCGELNVHFEGSDWETDKSQSPFFTEADALKIHTKHPLFGLAKKIQIWEQTNPERIIFEWNRPIEGLNT